MIPNQLGEAKEVFSLVFVLLLICFFTFVLVGFQYWEVWGILVIGALVMVEGCNLYFRNNRGSQK